MAVPISCFHQVLPNWKILDVITNYRSLSNNFFGKNPFISQAYESKYFLIVSEPSSGSMFAYIETASEVPKNINPD